MLKYSDKYVTGAWTSFFFFLPENWAKRLSSQSISGQYILIAEWLVSPVKRLWCTHLLFRGTENPQTTTSGD